MNANHHVEAIEVLNALVCGTRERGSLHREEVLLIARYNAHCRALAARCRASGETATDLIVAYCRRWDSDRRTRLERATDAPPT